MARQLGSAFEATGLGLQGKLGYVEKREFLSSRQPPFAPGRPLAFGSRAPFCCSSSVTFPAPIPFTTVVPCSSIVPVRASPKVSATSFVAPNSSVIGDVELGADSGVWYGAVVRGDIGAVKVGAGANLSDRVQLSGPSSIGSGVTVGSNSVLHSCRIGDSTLIEPNCRILAGATIGANSRLAANALVMPGASIGTGELWAGSPATLQRQLDASEIDALKHGASQTAVLAEAHDFETCKTHEEVFEDELDLADAEERQDDSHWYQPVVPTGRSGLLYDQKKVLKES